MMKMIHEEIDFIDEWGEEITLPVSRMIDLLQQSLLNVPEEYRKDAMLKIYATGDYARAHLNIQYDRPETDGERRAREQHDSRLMGEYEARERAEYARLKAKYDSQSGD
jgi:hypothetical protein